MSAQFHIDQDPELLALYQEECKVYYRDLENLSLLLEKDPANFDHFRKFKRLVEQVWLASRKLDVVPLVESLDILRTTLDFIDRTGIYPQAFSEFSLILLDRLCELVDQVKDTASVDMLKSQQIHVALQELMLSKTSDELASRIPTAVVCLVNGKDHKSAAPDMDIVLFDDGVELFDVATGSTSSELDAAAIQEYVAWITERNGQDAAKIMADIADAAIGHHQGHVDYMLPLAMLLNHVRGNQINRDDLYMAVCLHDVGLGRLPRDLLSAPQLSKEQRELIRKHPLISAQVATAMGASEIAIQGILQHHERVDGKGYPSNLKGPELTDIGKLMCVVDTFEAMTHIRTYRERPRGVLRAIAEINANSGAQFDAEWVAAFNEVMRKHWKLLTSATDARPPVMGYVI